MSKIVIENLAKRNIGRQELINMGFSAQKYDDILRGKSNYKLSDIMTISEKFQLSLDYLVYGEDRIPFSYLSDNEQRCLQAFKNLLYEHQIEFIARMEQRYEDYSPAQKESVS